MSRKYLDDIGVQYDYAKTNDSREELFKAQRETYGFDESETWALNTYFYMWLYERLNMYKETASKVVDLSFHKFSYDNREYTQKELIDLLLKDLRYVLVYGEWSDKYEKKSAEIGKVWALILPAMWW